MTTTPDPGRVYRLDDPSVALYALHGELPSVGIETLVDPEARAVLYGAAFRYGTLLTEPNTLSSHRCFLLVAETMDDADVRASLRAGAAEWVRCQPGPKALRRSLEELVNLDPLRWTRIDTSRRHQLTVILHRCGIVIINDVADQEVLCGWRQHVDGYLAMVGRDHHWMTRTVQEWWWHHHELEDPSAGVDRWVFGDGLIERIRVEVPAGRRIITATGLARARRLCQAIPTATPWWHGRAASPFYLERPVKVLEHVVGGLVEPALNGRDVSRLVGSAVYSHRRGLGFIETTPTFCDVRRTVSMMSGAERINQVLMAGLLTESITLGELVALIGIWQSEGGP